MALSESSSPKSAWWRDLLHSTVLAVAVAILLIGWLGNAIVSRYQERSIRRERFLQDHAKEVERQLAAATAAIQLLGEAHYQAEVLVKLTAPAFQASSPQHDELANAANAFFLRWEKEKYTTGAMLAYYHGEQEDVRTKWTAAVEATDKLLAAAQREYSEYAKNPKSGYVASIAKEEPEFQPAVDALAVALARAHAETVRER